MKATLFALAVAGAANAQLNPSDLPSCALGCLATALPSECSISDGIDAALECACPQLDSILEDDCFASNCEEAELEEGADVVRSACEAIGGGSSSSTMSGGESMTETVPATTVTSPTPTDDGSTTVTETETEGTTTVMSPTPTDDGDDGDDGQDDGDDGQDGGNGDDEGGDGGDGGEGGDDEDAAVKPFAGIAAAVVALMAAL